MEENIGEKVVKKIEDLSLEELMDEFFRKGKVPALGTEMDIWKLIEALGGIIFYTEHDAADDRISLDAEDNKRLLLMKQISNKLLQTIKD